MTMRQDTSNEDWPLRPWIMAAIGAIGGLIVHLLTDGEPGADIPIWKQAATTFTIIAVLSFLLTVEVKRWWWALAFAIGWGSVLALVGWFTAQYNYKGEIVEFPFLSGLLAVIVAAPLFQTVRDQGVWRFPYARLHRHAWIDAVIGAASLAFTGVTFLLAWLIASLFDVIGIEAIKDLLQEDWFGWMLAGFAFGGAVGLLRERDVLAATLQKLVMVVLAVLAPVLAVALGAFLLSLPFTGLSGLWESDIPATPMLLLSGAGAILLTNAVIGDGRDERSGNIWLRRSALLLVLCVLPLAVLAALSMGERISQYGWTPERIWGVVAVTIAIAYGAAAWWSVYRGRKDFDDPLRPLQTRLAIGLCGLALLLALPIVDFGAISARSQLARLESGKVKADEFDWAAMAFDFGPEGRERLDRIAKSGAPDQRLLAARALKETNRWTVSEASEARREGREIAERLRLASPDIVLTDELREAIGATYSCRSENARCALVRIGTERYLLVSTSGEKRRVTSAEIDLTVDRASSEGGIVSREVKSIEGVDIGKATLEIREIRRRQLHVDGKPVGEPFE